MGFQHHVAVTMGVAQRPVQFVAFQQVAVDTHLDPAAGAQAGQGAEDGGIVPAVGFALEFFEHAFQGGAHPAAVVAVDERQHLLLGLGQRSDIVAEQ